MSKVLILCEAFAPSELVGAFRSEGWARYMPSYGLTPTVVTRRLGDHSDFYNDMFPQVKVITFEERKHNELVPSIFRKQLSFLGFFWRFMAFNSKSRLKKHSMYKSALDELKSEDYQWIIATGPPYYVIKIAQLLAAEMNISWVADTRDAWTTNLVSRNKENLKNRVFRRLEKNIMGSAAFITTVSPTNVAGIKSVNTTKDVLVVENGFFIEDFIPLNGHEYDEREQFKICYLGTLYAFQPIELFFDALAEFKKLLKVDYRVDFIGTGKQPNATKRIMRHAQRFDDGLKVWPLQARQKALKMALDSNVLLLLADSDVHLLPTKVYDYVALQRPIIITKNDHSYIYDILSEYPQAYFCDTVEEILAVLSTIYQKSDLFKFSSQALKNERLNKKNLLRPLIERIAKG